MKHLLLPLLAVGAILVLPGCRRVRVPRDVKPVDRELLATGYCRCRKCCSWTRTWYGRPVYASGSLRGKPKRVGQTASGAMARRGTIAADTSRYPFGTIMQVEGYGYGTVQDAGGAIKGDRIDLFFATHKQALEWGRKPVKVRIWFPRD